MMDTRGASGGAPPVVLVVDPRNSTPWNEADSQGFPAHWEARRERRGGCEDGRPPAYAIGRCLEDGALRVVALPCKQRICLRCGKIRREIIAARVRRMVNQYDGRCLFLTLTLPQPEGHPSTRAWLEFSKKWGGFMLKLKRRIPRHMKAAKWAWVLEPHKSGWPHLHAVIVGMRFIPKQIISSCWSAVGGGNTKIETGGGGAGRYVAKYIAKQTGIDEDLADWLTDNGVRWFNATHREKAPPPPETARHWAWRWVPRSKIGSALEHLGIRDTSRLEVSPEDWYRQKPTGPPRPPLGGRPN